MKFGKKQLVLASLVLALGAAVYLNWQFAGTNRLPVGESSEESSQLGAAQLVNNAYVETVNDGLEANASSESGESGALSQARLDRQAARDEALDLLDEVLKDVESDSAAKQQAVDQASAIAENIQRGESAGGQGLHGLRGLHHLGGVQRGGLRRPGGLRYPHRPGGGHGTDGADGGQNQNHRHKLVGIWKRLCYNNSIEYRRVRFSRWSLKT